MAYVINSKDLNALLRFTQRVRASEPAANLQSTVGDAQLTRQAQQLASFHAADGLVFREARQFGVIAFGHANLSEQFSRDVITGHTALALRTQDAYTRYTNADITSSERLRRIEQQIVNREFSDLVRDAQNPTALFDRHGWDKIKSIESLDPERTGNAIAGTDGRDYYEQKTPPGVDSTKISGATNWNTGDDIYAFNRIRNTILQEPLTPLQNLADLWSTVGRQLRATASYLKSETDTLMDNWDSPAARVLKTRVGDSIRSMKVWADISATETQTFTALAISLTKARDDILKKQEELWRDLTPYLSRPVTAIEEQWVYERVKKAVREAEQIARGLADAYTDATAPKWSTPPRYPGLLDISPADDLAQQPPGAGPGGGAPGVPGGGAGGSGRGAPSVPGGASAAWRKQQEELRKQAAQMRAEEERRQKAYNDAVRKLQEDAKKQQEALNQQQRDLQRQQQQLQQQQQQLQQNPFGQQQSLQQNAPGQQDLEDMRRQLDDLAAQRPQPDQGGTTLPDWAPPSVPENDAAGLPGWVPTPLPGGLGSGLAGVGGGTGGGGVGGGGGGGFGRPSVSTGIPTSGAVDLMGRTGGGAATTGVGTPALTGRATGAGGVPFIPPMHPPMAGAGAGGGPTLGGRRNRPVLPEEAQKPAPKPRVVDPDGDGTTTARRYRDGDRRATVTEPARRPEVEGGQALGRLA